MKKLKTLLLKEEVQLLLLACCYTCKCAINRALKFKSILTNLETTIFSVTSTINDINQLNGQEAQDLENALMDELHKLIKELMKAKQLVRRCSEVAW